MKHPREFRVVFNGSLFRVQYRRRFFMFGIRFYGRWHTHGYEQSTPYGGGCDGHNYETLDEAKEESRRLLCQDVRHIDSWKPLDT